MKTPEDIQEFDHLIFANVKRALDNGKSYPRQVIDDCPLYLPDFRAHGENPYDEFPRRAIFAWLEAWLCDSRTRLFIPDVLLTYEFPLRWFMVGEGIDRDEPFTETSNLFKWNTARGAATDVLIDICTNQAKLASKLSREAAMLWIRAKNDCLPLLGYGNMSSAKQLEGFYIQFHEQALAACELQRDEMELEPGMASRLDALAAQGERIEKTTARTRKEQLTRAHYDRVNDIKKKTRSSGGGRKKVRDLGDKQVKAALKYADAHPGIALRAACDHIIRAMKDGDYKTPYTTAKDLDAAVRRYCKKTSRPIPSKAAPGNWSTKS